MAKQHRYDIDLNHPEIIKLCESCTRVDCPGICLDYKNLSRKLAGFRRLRFREKKEPNLIHSYNKQFEAYGESHTLREWAKITGKSYNTLYKRMTARNITMQEAIEKPPYCVEINYNGEEMTAKEWAKKLGMNYTTLRNRLSNGWTVEQALTTPVLPHGISREEWENGNRNDTGDNHKESDNADR